MRAIWRQRKLIIDGRVWAEDVSVDKAAEILAELAEEFPKSAPGNMYVEK